MLRGLRRGRRVDWQGARAAAAAGRPAPRRRPGGSVAGVDPKGRNVDGRAGPPHGHGKRAFERPILKPEASFGPPLFALLGVGVFWRCFVIIDKLTPRDLWAQSIE